MILRIWRCPVADGKLEPFQSFMRTTLFPTLDEHDACQGITTAVDHSNDTPVIVAVSVWTTRDALTSFTGPSTNDVIFEDAEAFLAGDPTVEHLHILEHRF